MIHESLVTILYSFLPHLVNHPPPPIYCMVYIMLHHMSYLFDHERCLSEAIRQKLR